MITNYERIKQMSVEEMAEFLDEYLSCSFCQSKLFKETLDTYGCQYFCPKRFERINQQQESEAE